MPAKRLHLIVDRGPLAGDFRSNAGDGGDGGDYDQTGDQHVFQYFPATIISQGHRHEPHERPATTAGGEANQSTEFPHRSRIIGTDCDASALDSRTFAITSALP